mmetsp:Transcript_39777/g.110522  ORF Transcript_39777/g.110522 Transcript_39777/m.110522 type:complete len:203 (+) Transcript_39777:104-712(+)
MAATSPAPPRALGSERPRAVRRRWPTSFVGGGSRPRPYRSTPCAPGRSAPRRSTTASAIVAAAKTSGMASSCAQTVATRPRPRRRRRSRRPVLAAKPARPTWTERIASDTSRGFRVWTAVQTACSSRSSPKAVRPWTTGTTPTRSVRSTRCCSAHVPATPSPWGRAADGRPSSGRTASSGRTTRCSSWTTASTVWPRTRRGR